MKKIILLATIICLYISCGRSKAEKLREIKLSELSDRITKMDNSREINNLERKIDDLEREIRSLKYNNNDELERKINKLDNYINQLLVPNISTNQYIIDNNIENLNKRINNLEFQLRYR